MYEFEATYYNRETDSDVKRPIEVDMKSVYTDGHPIDLFAWQVAAEAAWSQQQKDETLWRVRRTSIEEVSE